MKRDRVYFRNETEGGAIGPAGGRVEWTETYFSQGPKSLVYHSGATFVQDASVAGGWRVDGEVLYVDKGYYIREGSTRSWSTSLVAERRTS